MSATASLVPADQTLKMLGGDHEESYAFDRDCCHRVRCIPEESHFSQQVALDESVQDPLRSVNPVPHLDRANLVEHQVRQVRASAEPDDFVNPAELGSIARLGLKEAFRIIGKEQQGIATRIGANEVFAGKRRRCRSFDPASRKARHPPAFHCGRCEPPGRSQKSSRWSMVDRWAAGRLQRW
jgi:hypothetical protein